MRTELSSYGTTDGQGDKVNFINRCAIDQLIFVQLGRMVEETRKGKEIMSWLEGRVKDRSVSLSNKRVNCQLFSNFDYLTGYYFFSAIQVCLYFL